MAPMITTTPPILVDLVRPSLQRWSVWHRSLQTWATPSQLSTQTQSSCEWIENVLTWWRHWWWVRRGRHTLMVRICLTYSLMRIILRDHQRWTLQRLELAEYASTPTSMHVVRFAWVCWEHGGVMHLRIGIQRFLRYCRYWFQHRQ